MYAWVILLILGLLLHDPPVDLAGPDLGGSTAVLFAGHPIGWLLGLSAGLKLLLAASYGLVLWRTGRQLDRGRIEPWLPRSRRLGVLFRAAAVAIYGLDLSCGWIEAVRGLVGDIVLIDELLVLTPTLALWAWSWWCDAGIDRRLRQAVWMRQIDQGHTPPAVPSRGRYLLRQLRHQVGPVLVPAMTLLGWWEALPYCGLSSTPWLLAGGEELTSPRELGFYAGVLGLMLLSPWMLRLVWSTTALPGGTLRESVVALAERSGVKLNGLLLWKTDGAMANAAVTGFIRPLRYLLLSDALLENMDLPLVQAVTAHELAHVRRRHLFWLAMLALALGVALSTAFDAATPLLEAEGASDWLRAGATLTVGGSGVLVWAAVFGWISRRFERQADTFAAVQLTRLRDDQAT
ncbi:MAG: M48 family metalloprotease, partial [Phycisphaeraceae bacterium]|nr:M48 family metalloprotease [Phycisphaeraceae bacterium]